MQMTSLSEACLTLPVHIMNGTRSRPSTASFGPYDLAADHIRSPLVLVDWLELRIKEEPLAFSPLPSSVDLVSLALTNPRWAVVPNHQDVAWLWGKRNWLATAPRETMIWNCPPTVDTQHWTKYKRFKKERKWAVTGRIENSTDCCSASNISCLCVWIVLLWNLQRGVIKCTLSLLVCFY